MESQNLDDLRALLELLRAHGVTHYEGGGLRLNVLAAPLAPAPKRPPAPLPPEIESLPPGEREAAASLFRDAFWHVTGES